MLSKCTHWNHVNLKIWFGILFDDFVSNKQNANETFLTWVIMDNIIKLHSTEITITAVICSIIAEKPMNLKNKENNNFKIKLFDKHILCTQLQKCDNI